MRRLRLLRFLLPAVLLLFVWIVIVAVRPRPTVHTAPADETTDQGKRGEGLRLSEYIGADRSLSGEIKRMRQDADGRLMLEGIHEFQIERESGSPLVISADLGDIEGASGSRTMLFRDGVVVHDADNGLTLTLPRLEIDEAAGEARSTSGLTIEGKLVHGTADSLVYGLTGQPTVLEGLSFADSDGLSVRAGRAILIDGLDDLELQDAVRVERGPERVHTDRLRLERDETGRLRRARADVGVDGTLALETGRQLQVSAESADVRWDADGLVASLDLRGSALVRSEAQSLAAARIRAQRPDGGSGWAVTAVESVHLQGPVNGQAAWLRADALDAALSDSLELLGGHASGRVRFEGPDIRAEAERARLERDGDGSRIVLEAEGLRKARLSRGSTRVAANTIRTDGAGQQLDAEGAVEATMLPGTESAGVGGMFRLDEAIHFVADRLDGREGGARLAFSGSVRAWQGERNLAADRVTLDRAAASLVADGSVNTRVPRTGDQAAVREEDYLQVRADHLVYEEQQRRATYTGSIRLVMREGWMEAKRLEIDLESTGGGIREVRAAESVRLEFREQDEIEEARLVNAVADRLVWVPDEQTVWLIGDASPATVRRPGEGGGTTSGRLLRYDLGSGALEVDSGEQAPARIQTRPGTR